MNRLSIFGPLGYLHIPKSAALGAWRVEEDTQLLWMQHHSLQYVAACLGGFQEQQRVAVNSSTLCWQSPVLEKVAEARRKDLRGGPEDTAGGIWLLCFLPQFTCPSFKHYHNREAYCISGEIQIGDVRLNTGDYMYVPGGSVLPAHTTEQTACLLLLHTDQAVRADFTTCELPSLTRLMET